MTCSTKPASTSATHDQRAGDRGGRRAGRSGRPPSPTSPGPPSATPTLQASDRGASAPAASPTPGAPPSSAPKTTDAEPITHDTLDAIWPPERPMSRGRQRWRRSPPRHRLFHWHLEFPEIFRVPDDGPANTPTGWSGGFSAVLGNPPWETGQDAGAGVLRRSRPDDRRRARTPPRARRPSPRSPTSNPDLFEEFALRSGDARGREPVPRGQRPLPALRRRRSQHLQRLRRALPRHACASTGGQGIITPTGLATDATTAAFFADSLRSATAGRLLRLRERGEDLRRRASTSFASQSRP